MTLHGGEKEEDVVVVIASTIPPEYETTTATTETATAYEENSANDYSQDLELTLFIASSSIIIMTLITIIVLVSCFILCNEGKDMTFAQRSLINSMSSSSALNLIASHGQYFAGQLSSMDHNFLENDSPEEELEEDKLEPEEDENADDTGDYMPPLLQGHRVTLEDYFPSPTRILHEIQMQVLEKQRLKQKSKDIETGKIL